MLFAIKRASTWNNEEPLLVNSLEELLQFVEKEGSIVIDKYKDGYEILIYDDYIE